MLISSHHICIRCIIDIMSQQFITKVICMRSCRVVLVVLLVLVGLWFGLDTAKDPKRFISVLGMLVYIGISYLLSSNRKKASALHPRFDELTFYRGFHGGHVGGLKH